MSLNSNKIAFRLVKRSPQPQFFGGFGQQFCDGSGFGQQFGRGGILMILAFN